MDSQDEKRYKKYPGVTCGSRHSDHHNGRCVFGDDLGQPSKT